MENTIVQLSKYVITFLMICFTVQSFAALKERDEDERHYILMRQIIMIILMNFICFFVMFLQEGEVSTIQMFLLTMAYILGVQILYRLIYRNVSRLLVNNTCMLLCVGFIMLTRLSLDKAVKQFAIVVISAAVTWLIPWVMERVWQLCKLQWVYAAAGLAVLLLVCVAGNESFGAQLSLTVGGISIQPSEFVKITFVFFVAAMFYQSLEFKTILVTTAVAALHVVIMVASKDLGGALIFFITYVAMLFIATGRWSYLLAGAGCGAGAVCKAPPRRNAANSSGFMFRPRTSWMILQILLFGLCRFQLTKLLLQLCDLGLVFFNVLFDTVKFVCHSQNSFLASRQTPVTIEMLLPITRIEVGVGNGVATVQHHGIAHINADVGNAGGVVGADEKYKVAGLWALLRGKTGVQILQRPCAPSRPTSHPL